jgi:hypothetical protein
MGYLPWAVEASGCLVAPAVFKTDVAEYLGQAGSIPVRLRHYSTGTVIARARGRAAAGPCSAGPAATAPTPPPPSTLSRPTDATSRALRRAWHSSDSAERLRSARRGTSLGITAVIGEKGG